MYIYTCLIVFIYKLNYIFMRKFFIILLISQLALINVSFSQENTDIKPVKKNYFKFQARLKAGMGQTFKALPTRFDATIFEAYRDTTFYETGIDNNFLNTKWGFYGGANFDFYLHPNFGLGLDFDYFNNKLEFSTPQLLTDYMDSHGAKLIESNRTNQQLIFVGIGPSFKLFTNDKWDIDLNIRGGLSHINLGSLRYDVDSIQEDLNENQLLILNYDYSKPINAIGLKAGLYFNYWFNKWIGVTIGADYIHTFISSSKIEDDPDCIFQYKDPQYFILKNGAFDARSYFDHKAPDHHPKSLNINHFSASAGLVFRFIDIKEPKPKAKDKDITVLVKDSLTGIPVQGVTVSLKNKVGSVIETKKTEPNGKATFANIAPGDYVVSGAMGSLTTGKAFIDKPEFDKSKKVIYRELLLNNLNFILEGYTEECTKKQTIGNVQVELTNKSTGETTKINSGPDGKFSFNLSRNTDYDIVGSRDGYYSGIQQITTKGLNRSKTIYVKLTLCVEQLEVGKTFVLNNIYYDFDKCNIRSDASVELDRLVDIMKTYPKMEIELSSHTDQRGSDAYNNKLSQCRAESAVSYIIAKGISKTRINAKGYGKTRLLKDCSQDKDCTQSSQGDCPCHQNNRRTEVKILKM